MLAWCLMLAALSVSAAAPLAADTCGYESCAPVDPQDLNVHIVAHTHDDVGWLKTVDQYYYGSKNRIQVAGVQYIIDSVVEELWKDASKRFIYVETAFFWKWWTRQKETVRQRVRTLVSQGRLEFIGGAWSMNDEADTRYQSTIDQFTWGLRKLNDTFGECGRPRIGWQIDPFGHSREFASLLADMGYDGLFHGRIDYQDKDRRMRDKAMEMVWRGNDDLGPQSDIFTGILYNTYSPPPGFCFDILCSDEPIIDDVDSPMYNVDRRVDTFFAIAQNMSGAYKTRNVLVTMGEDFNYQDAHVWFKNLDLLITYANLKAAKDKQKIKLFYSTPSCYLKAVNDAKPRLPTKRDDFMPYASDAHSYWSGYFTSRPCVKYFERRGNAYLQMVKQLQVLANLEHHDRFLVNELKSAMGIMQHHDAVTGTEKQHVADDYSRILDAAIEDGLFVAKKAFSKLIERSPHNLTDLQLTRCQLNISECAPTENKNHFTVVVYNPLSWPVTEAIRLPVTHSQLVVYDHRGGEVPSQLVELPASLVKVPTRYSSARSELVFLASAPALGYVSYFLQLPNTRRKRSAGDEDDFLSRREKIAINAIAKYLSKSYYAENTTRTTQEYANDKPQDYQDYQEKDASSSSAEHFNIERMSAEEIKQMLKENERSLAKFAGNETEPEAEGGVKYVPLRTLFDRMLGDSPATVQVYSEDDYIQNEHMKLTVNRATGELTSLALSDGTSVPFDVDLLYYPGWAGDNQVAAKRSSGAYIFRPNVTGGALPLDVRNTTKIIKGPIVQEIHQEYSNFSSAVFRLYNESRFLEVEWLVGPIPVQDKIGKEIVVRYNTNLSNNQIFYTDSNGKQSLKRVLNHRPQYNLSVHEAIAGNYYPVNSKIYIEDSAQNLRLSILNDRAQGGSSLNEGQIELMVHRRLLHDDAFGVGEALDEVAEGVGLVARGKHYVHLDKITTEAKQLEKIKGIEIVQPLEVLVSNNSELVLDDWRWFNNEWSGIKVDTPKGIHLLTLEHWRRTEILVRLENIFEKSDLDKNDDGSRLVDLSKLFNMKFKSIEETSLAANQFWKDRKRMRWDTEGFEGNAEAENARTIDGFVVDLRPGQIRTFIIGYEVE